MRVFVTSTSAELRPYRRTAADVARALGFHVVSGEPELETGGEPDGETVAARVRRLAGADLVLALVGHRRGRPPLPELGGDGFRPWAWWETRAAFDRGLPVRVLMASPAWQVDPRQEDAKARGVMRDFRGELGRLAVLFDEDDDFRALVREELLAARQDPGRQDRDPEGPALALRRFPPPPLPARPYPALLPYNHPDLLAGRERELAEVRRLLRRPVLILGLQAASGVGKSSLLAGGLLPALRAEGRPVAFERHPGEPGIVSRLLGDLLADGEALADPGLDDPRAFVDRLRAVGRQARVPPVLVLDQLEDLMRHDAGETRKVVGTLLAASAQRLPGQDGPVCRWLLAYRQELHGQVFHWLRDVSRDVVGDASRLPHDLAGADRFQAWALPPLGTPAAGTEKRVEAATRIFQRVIEKPLALRSEGKTPYPWRFAADGAARLARVFGEARVARRTAPLAPELQVVTAHLLQRAGRAAGDGVVEIAVPDEPGELIDRALEEHLKRSLDFAFPARRTTNPRIRRTRALLALRELADVHGRRGGGRSAAALERGIGDHGRDVLEKLATPSTRIVLLERRDREAGEGYVYTLSHDRMADVIVRQVEDEGSYAALGVDAELLALRRFVSLQCQLFAAGETEQATLVPKQSFRRIEAHQDALLWDEKASAWWAACRARRRRDRRRTARHRALAAAATASLLLGVVAWAGHTLRRRELLDTVEKGDPSASFAALARLSAEAADAGELSERLSRRRAPFDVLERGLVGVDPEARGPAVLRVAELLSSLHRRSGGRDPTWIASTVWALDFFVGTDPALERRARALRDEVLRPLRRHRPPPPLPGPEDPEWVEIPAGTFLMGSDEREDGDKFEEWPRHRVTISTFRLGTHEVTNAEYRRLVPEHWQEEAPELPAAYVNWYEAYTYAAWLGGRLPTEAEWEYAARAGCPYPYCRRDGSAATLDEVAWWIGTSADPRTGDSVRRPVGRLEANPWGLHDVYGNVSEWTADWAGPYSEGPGSQQGETDPPGPVSPTALGMFRIFRGGNAFFLPKEPLGAATRKGRIGVERMPHYGLRVVFPFDASPVDASLVGAAEPTPRRAGRGTGG